jgi:hypothetical protein
MLGAVGFLHSCVMYYSRLVSEVYFLKVSYAVVMYSYLLWLQVQRVFGYKSWATNRQIDKEFIDRLNRSSFVDK